MRKAVLIMTHADGTSVELSIDLYGSMADHLVQSKANNPITNVKLAVELPPTDVPPPLQIFNWNAE